MQGSNKTGTTSKSGGGKESTRVKDREDHDGTDLAPLQRTIIPYMGMQSMGMNSPNGLIGFGTEMNNWNVNEGEKIKGFIIASTIEEGDRSLVGGWLATHNGADRPPTSGKDAKA